MSTEPAAEVAVETGVGAATVEAPRKATFVVKDHDEQPGLGKYSLDSLADRLGLTIRPNTKYSTKPGDRVGDLVFKTEEGEEQVVGGYFNRKRGQGGRLVKLSPEMASRLAELEKAGAGMGQE